MQKSFIRRALCVVPLIACGSPPPAAPAPAPTPTVVITAAHAAKKAPLTFLEALAVAKDGAALPEPEPTVLALEKEAPALEKAVLATRNWSWSQRPQIEWFTEAEFFKAARPILARRMSHFGLKVTDHYLEEGIVAVYDVEENRILASREPHRTQRTAAGLRRNFATAIAEAIAIDAHGHVQDAGIAGELAWALRRGDARAAAYEALEGPKFRLGLRSDWRGHYGSKAGSVLSLRFLAAHDGMGAAAIDALADLPTRAERLNAIASAYAHPPTTFAHHVSTAASRADLRPFVTLAAKPKLPFVVTAFDDPGYDAFLRVLLEDDTSRACKEALASVRGAAEFAEPSGNAIVYLVADGPGGTILRTAFSTQGATIKAVKNGFLAALIGTNSTFTLDKMAPVKIDRDETAIDLPTPTPTNCDRDLFRISDKGRLRFEDATCGWKNHTYTYANIQKTPFSDAPSDAADWLEDRVDSGGSPEGYTRATTALGVGFQVTAIVQKRYATQLFVPICGGKRTVFALMYGDYEEDKPIKFPALSMAVDDAELCGSSKED